ncbi:MAG: C40 family peptidase [Eggerthellaceae bacterium]|nr:C40 family peptidase [Eggerthellaceae bacterium]
MYRTGPESFLDVLLASRTFEEFATNWDMLNSLNAADAALVERSKESRQALENAKANYAAQSETAAHEAAAAKAVHDEAMVTVSEMEAVYRSLSDEAAELLASMESEMASITDEEELARLAEEGAAAQAEWSASASNEVPAAPLFGGVAGVAGGAAGQTGAANGNAGGSASAGAGSSGAAQAGASESRSEQPASRSQPESSASPEPEPQVQPEPEPEPQLEPEPQPEPQPEPEPEPQPDPEPESEPEPEPTPAYTEPVVDYNVDLGSRVVDVALQFLGWPYVWGGKSPASGGFDCSGFVSYCYSQAGSYAPSWTGALTTWGYGVTDPQPGDVCIIHQESGAMNQHAGIYYGNGQMIHAATYGVGVIIGPVQAGMAFRRSG